MWLTELCANIPVFLADNLINLLMLANSQVRLEIRWNSRYANNLELLLFFVDKSRCLSHNATLENIK